MTDAEALWDWAMSCAVEHGSMKSQFHTAVFILNVWNCTPAVAIGDSPTPWPRFDLFGAWGFWETEDLEAFKAWASKPWCV